MRAEPMVCRAVGAVNAGAILMPGSPRLPGRAGVGEAIRGPRTRPRGRRAGLVAAVAASLVAWGDGPALASDVSCGATVAGDTTLRADLLNCPGDGLVIGVDNITLDLNHHTIDGDGVPGAAQLDRGVRLAGHRGVKIQGGTIQEFDTGVLLDAATGNTVRRLTLLRNIPGRGIDLENHSDGNRIQDNTSTDNARSAIVVISSDDNLVRANTGLRNGLTGILVRDGHHNRVEANTLAANVFNDIALDQGSSDNVIRANSATTSEMGILLDNVDANTVTHNHVFGDADDIIVSGNRNAVVGNVITDALGCEDNGCGAGIASEGGTDNLIAANSITRTRREGIRVNEFEAYGGAAAVGTIVRANIVRAAATDGIAVATSTDPGSIGGTVKDTRLETNIVIGSGHDGINVASAATTLTRNLALRNANLGIEAVPGVTDGGGNHAFGNGNPAQCVNIAC
jgi:parallel beta-helix repeat protein